MRFLLFAAFFVTLESPVAAQPLLSTKNKKAIELYNEADNYRVRGQYQLALQLLQESVERDKNFAEAYFRQGIIYKTLRHYDESTAQFLKGLSLVSDSRRQRPYFYELGDNYLLEGEYQKSLDFLNRYLDGEVTNQAKTNQASLWKKNAQYGLKNMRDVSHFQPHELSDTINAFAMQYFPVLTADEQEMIFTRRIGPSETDDEDLVISKRDAKGRWTRPESISSNINSRLNEGTCTISADGRQLIFTSCAGRSGFGSCDLYESIKTGNEWSRPVNLGPAINTSSWESQPSLSADGRTLFFVSERRGGKGGKDIYVSTRQPDNQWTKAVNLGEKINTPYDEISPFIHVNGRSLFYASNGKPGFGGFDIFLSEQDGTGWSESVNFGYPVNNHEDQFSLFITANSEHAYYSHENHDRLNASSIYELVVPEDMRLRYKSNWVKGIVRDRKTHLPLKARVELFSLSSNQLISYVESDSVDGDYLMVLTEGADYALYVSRPGYLFRSLHFNYEAEGKIEPVVVDVDLDPVETGASAVLQNIFFDLNKYELKEKSITELEKVIRFLQENPKVRIEISGHTDNQGSASYNIQLSQKRAQAVAEYLIAHSIPSGRLVQKGYGADRPLKPNDTEENRQVNRRIEFRVIH